MTERSSASAEGETYELPDEVRESACGELHHVLSPKIGKIRLDDHEGIEYDTAFFRAAIYQAVDAVTPILAAHFERIGAEKMREAAAELAEHRMIAGGGGEFIAGRIRALPLPPQRHTEEIANG